MKILITILLLISPVLVYAQTGVTQETPMVDQGVADNKKVMIDDLNQLAALQQGLAGQQQSVIDAQNKIVTIQTDLTMRQQAMTALATQTPPIQTAADAIAADAQLGVPSTNTDTNTDTSTGTSS